jgi:hypothetical protein
MEAEAMNDYRYSMARELEQLRERVMYLEESNLRYVNIIDTLATSTEFQTILNQDRGRSAGSIFQATFIQLKRLLPFDRMIFYSIAAGNNFDLASCYPSLCEDELQRELESRIIDGSFAWAVNQNRPSRAIGEARRIWYCTPLRPNRVFVACLRGFYPATGQIWTQRHLMLSPSFWQRRLTPLKAKHCMPCCGTVCIHWNKKLLKGPST